MTSWYITLRDSIGEVACVIWTMNHTGPRLPCLSMTYCHHLADCFNPKGARRQSGGNLERPHFIHLQVVSKQVPNNLRSLIAYVTTRVPWGDLKPMSWQTACRASACSQDIIRPVLQRSGSWKRGINQTLTSLFSALLLHSLRYIVNGERVAGVWPQGFEPESLVSFYVGLKSYKLLLCGSKD